jgi:hypothetical protein
MATDPEFDEYIKLVWSGWSKAVFGAQKQLLTWLFAFHGAGIAGTLGYANSRGIRCSVVVALIMFVAGIVSLLLWGTLMYYFGVKRFRAMKHDLDEVHADRMTTEQFYNAEKSRSGEYRSCEIIAWISGLCGIAGLISLILAVVQT